MIIGARSASIVALCNVVAFVLHRSAADDVVWLTRVERRDARGGAACQTWQSGGVHVVLCA
jgi:hypothetical protein